MPVEPGKIEEYVLRLCPFANTFKPGHRLVVELSNGEPLADEQRLAAARSLSPARGPPCDPQDPAMLRIRPGWCCRLPCARRRRIR